MEYIVFEDVQKSYESEAVLKNLNLNIKKGEFVTLLGPSGCGKSTLLRCLAGLERLSSGKIFVDGKEITEEKTSKRNIGMVFQQYSLFPTMNIYNNVAFGLKMKGMKKNEIDALVKDALNLVNLSGCEKKYPCQLSGGEKQRVALCRSIVTKPKVLLMDEPFSAIDAKLRKTLQIKIREIHDKLGMTTIFVTHDQDEAMNMSDTIHLMNNGVIEQSGKPEELYSSPKTRFAASFMGNYNIVKVSKLNQLVHNEFHGEEICFRPEVVQISVDKPEYKENEIILHGKICDVIVQGSIILYKVSVREIMLKVSILFNNIKLYSINEKVFIKISKDNIICFD